MSTDITGPQLSLLRTALGLGFATMRPTRNWLPQVEATDHLGELSVLLEKGLLEVGKGTPIFYMATAAGKSLAMSRQNYDKEVARGR